MNISWLGRSFRFFYGIFYSEFLLILSQLNLVVSHQCTHNILYHYMRPCVPGQLLKSEKHNMCSLSGFRTHVYAVITCIVHAHCAHIILLFEVRRVHNV